MGKIKGRGDEHSCRINYLFQAGKLAAKCAPDLSQYYGQVLTVITEKTAPKKDFTMKRSMCKKCHAVLNIGENATYRVRKNKHKKASPVMVIGCMVCGERKCLPTAKRGYKIKAERDGKIINSGGFLSRHTSPSSGANSENDNKKSVSSQQKNSTMDASTSSAAVVIIESTDSSANNDPLDTIMTITPAISMETDTEMVLKDNQPPENVQTQTDDKSEIIK